MDFIVKKRYWLRGGKKDSISMLRNRSGKMCCLGFVANQLGFSYKEIINCGTPEDLDTSHINKTNIKLDKAKLNLLKPLAKYDTFGVFNNTNLSEKAIEINDDDSTTDSEKIEKLTRLFKKYKHTITFV